MRSLLLKEFKSNSFNKAGQEWMADQTSAAFTAV